MVTHRRPSAHKRMTIRRRPSCRHRLFAALATVGLSTNLMLQTGCADTTSPGLPQAGTTRLTWYHAVSQTASGMAPLFGVTDTQSGARMIGYGSFTAGGVAGHMDALVFERPNNDSLTAVAFDAGNHATMMYTYSRSTGHRFPGFIKFERPTAQTLNVALYSTDWISPPRLEVLSVVDQGGPNGATRVTGIYSRAASGASAELAPKVIATTPLPTRFPSPTTTRTAIPTTTTTADSDPTDDIAQSLDDLVDIHLGPPPSTGDMLSSFLATVGAKLEKGRPVITAVAFVGEAFAVGTVGVPLALGILALNGYAFWQSTIKNATHADFDPATRSDLEDPTALDAPAQGLLPELQVEAVEHTASTGTPCTISYACIPLGTWRLTMSCEGRSESSTWKFWPQGPFQSYGEKQYIEDEPNNFYWPLLAASATLSVHFDLRTSIQSLTMSVNAYPFAYDYAGIPTDGYASGIWTSYKGFIPPLCKDAAQGPFTMQRIG